MLALEQELMMAAAANCAGSHCILHHLPLAIKKKNFMSLMKQ